MARRFAALHKIRVEIAARPNDYREMAVIIRNYWHLLFITLLVISGNFALAAETLQNIKNKENQRLADHDFFEKAVKTGGWTQKKAALYAIGRIGDASQLDYIATLLSKKDRSLRDAAVFSLSLMQGQVPFMIIKQNLPMHQETHDFQGSRNIEGLSRSAVCRFSIETKSAHGARVVLWSP